MRTRPGSAILLGLLLAVLLGLLLALLPHALAAQVTDSIEASLLEVRLGRLTARTLPALRIGDEALLPLGQFFELAEVKASLDSAGRFAAVLAPEGISISVEAGGTHARANERFIAIPPGYVRLRDGELYLAASVLAALLEVEIAVDWSTLEVAVADPSRFPVSERHRRARARAALATRDREANPTRVVAPSRRVWDGFVLDYSWFAPSSDLIGGSSYAVAAGADLLGGSLEASLRSSGRADAGDVAVDGSWLGVWRSNRWIRQLRLGDGPASGPRPRHVRGIYLTNAPYVRPSFLGSYAYTGRLPSGWEVEAYRGGQLVGLDSVLSDGTYAVDVPVLFGENPLEFVAYGPFGERQTFSRTYRAPSALLPAGRVEYAASAGACRLAPCDATANADLRVGVSRRWTASAGMERIWRDSLSDLSHPYLSATGSLSHAWTLQADAVASAFVRGGLAFEPTLNLRVGADYTRFDRGAAAPFMNPLGHRSQLRLATLIRPDSRRDLFYFDGTAEFATRADGTSMRVHGGVSAQLGGLRLQPYARVERDAAGGADPVCRTFTGLTAFLIPTGRAGALFRRSWIRASYESEGLSTPRLATISVARPLLHSLRIETGVSWVRAAGAPSFTLTLASTFDALRSFTSVNAQAGSPATLTQALQGSILYDRLRGVALDAGPALQRAGVAGIVFLDRNGNGVRDPAEQGLPNVRVQVGNTSATTDSVGRYRVWDIVPFEPVLVAADSMSFDSPLWVASDDVLAVLPSPNRFTGVDVPLRTGAVLEGRVVRAFGAAEQGIAGATLELREPRTGRRRSVVTFTDGSFYMLGVPPGDYELAVGTRTLDLLRQTAQPLRLTVSPEGDVPAGLTIRLQPAPPP